MSATILRVNLNSVNPGSAVVVGRTIKTTTNNGTSWTEVADADLPTWFTEAVRGWVFTDPGSGGVVWAIQVHVPISAAGLTSGLDLGTEFKLWYEAKVGTPGGVANKFQWPVGVTWVTGLTTSLESYPSPTTYGNAHLSTGSTDVTCTSGVSISVSDIGTTNVPSNRVNISSTAPYPVNTFFARPLNNTGAPIAVNGITARFRIANWGSIGVNATWEDIIGGGAVKNSVPIPVGPQPATFYPIQFNHAFDPSEPLVVGILNGTKSRDQCLLVELSGPGITFINSSVRRNLQFVGGSVVDQGADISVEGLAPISGGRDVYLQVQKYLMPETAGPGDTLRDTTQLFNPRMGLAAVRMPPQPTIRQITAWIPSYRVHVYHSTGANIWIDGVKYPLLEQQSSFGFFVIHRGPLEGWGSILEGAQPMGPNWFRIRNVVGVAKIRTRIQARAPGEPPIKPEGGGGGIKCPGSKLLGGIVLSLGMLAMAWVSYRKPKRRN